MENPLVAKVREQRNEAIFKMIYRDVKKPKLYRVEISGVDIGLHTIEETLKTYSKTPRTNFKFIPEN